MANTSDAMHLRWINSHHSFSFICASWLCATMGKKSQASKGSLSLSQLLQRPCVCLARVCLQQFSGCQSAVLAARESFRQLEPSQKATWFRFIYLLLGFKNASHIGSSLNCFFLHPSLLGCCFAKFLQCLIWSINSDKSGSSCHQNYKQQQRGVCAIS